MTLCTIKIFNDENIERKFKEENKTILFRNSEDNVEVALQGYS